MWILILLAAVAIAIGAYYFLKNKSNAAPPTGIPAPSVDQPANRDKQT